MTGAGSTGGGSDEAERQTAAVAAARARFTAITRRPEKEIDLAEAALLIAAEEYPGLEVDDYLKRLDDLAQRVRQHIHEPTAREASDLDEAALRALHTVLFQEDGFCGAEENHDHPRHSFLNEVLDRKRGLPILLCVVYCEVARRAGLEAVGINLPGHFIAQFRGTHLSVYVDPFHGGTHLELEDCARLASQAAGQTLPISAEQLVPATKKQILARMLNNLKHAYVRRRKFTKALAAVERILMVSMALDQVRDRGLILRAMNLPGPAWFDLKLYSRLAEGATDAAAMGDEADQLWQQMGRMN